MNPMDLFKNVQQLQGQLQETQEKIKTVTASGSAGGGMVKIEMNGTFNVLSIAIDPEVIDPAEPALLQDLVRAAHNDAVANLRERLQEELSDLTGGLQLPPGLFG